MHEDTLVETVWKLKHAYDESNQLAALTLVRLEAIADRLEATPTVEQVDDKALVIKRQANRRANMLFGLVAAVLLLAFGLGLSFQVQNARRRNDDLARRQSEAISTRANLIAGCERGNDQRLTLAQVISLAITEIPIPAGATAVVVEQTLDRNIQAKALRGRLLALPGIQPINCAAAYP